MPNRMPFEMPPMFGIPALIEALGGVQADPSKIDQDSARSQQVMTPAEGNPGIMRKLAAILGVFPQQGETMGSFWDRMFPGGSLPPSLRGDPHVGEDIELPADKQRGPLRRKTQAK